MLIVGERINTSRKAVNEAVEKRDAAYIQADVKAQVEAGADIIDVNAGSRSASELDDLQWLINVIEEAVPARLSLDSSNPDVLAAVIGKVRDLPMLNSTTAEKARFEKMAPVIRRRECDVVGLCIGERGIPKTADQVLENAIKLVADLEAIGVKRERIHLDPLVQTVSVDNKAALTFLEAIERINTELPGVKTVCGLFLFAKEAACQPHLPCSCHAVRAPGGADRSPGPKIDGNAAGNDGPPWKGSLLQDVSQGLQGGQIRGLKRRMKITASLETRRCIDARKAKNQTNQTNQTNQRNRSSLH
jgi:hypothetical protein